MAQVPESIGGSSSSSPLSMWGKFSPASLLMKRPGKGERKLAAAVAVGVPPVTALY